MLVNSWFSARRARSGNTVCVWVTNQRISCSSTIIIANSVNLNCTQISSSTPVIWSEYLCPNALLSRRLSRKVRQSSTTSHHTAAAGNRMSRSHSPSHSRQQASKRRNTMNSRDAAFDENLKEILESTAHEADGTHDSKVDNDDEDMEPAPTGRRKRKRADDDA